MRVYAEDIIVKEGLPELDINFILKPITPSDLLTLPMAEGSGFTAQYDKKVRTMLDSQDTRLILFFAADSMRKAALLGTHSSISQYKSCFYRPVLLRTWRYRLRGSIYRVYLCRAWTRRLFQC